MENGHGNQFLINTVLSDTQFNEHLFVEHATRGAKETRNLFLINRANLSDVFPDVSPLPDGNKISVTEIRVISVAV